MEVYKTWANISFKLGCTCQIRIGGSISVRQTGHSSSLDWRLKVHNIMRFCLTCRRQTPPPPASALWPPPAAAGWQQATPSWPRPPSCPPPPSPPPPKWTRPGMLEAWQAHLTLHEKLSLLGELLPEDSPSTKAAFSLQLKMKMLFFILYPQPLHHWGQGQLCQNYHQKKHEVKVSCNPQEIFHSVPSKL